MSIDRGYIAANTLADTTKPVTTNPALGNGEIKRVQDYAKFPDKKIEDAKGVKDFRDKAKLADKPTTADGEKGVKDLPSIVSQVGAASAFLPNMYSMMALITAMTSGKSQTSRKTVIQDSLSGALAILVHKFDYDMVMNALDKALANNGIKYIDENYRKIVKNAIANLYKAAVEFGPNNVPVYQYSSVTTIGPVPSPLVTTVPDLYVQEYHIQAEDPYPGYIKWNSPDGSAYVFTERKIGDKYYVSPQEEIYSASEQELATDLEPYIRDQNLTAAILNDLLRKQDVNVEANTKEKTLGKGTGSGNDNSLRLIVSLLGYISVITNLQRSIQLPVSVLNQGSINTSLNAYEKNMAELRNIKEKTKVAATPLQPYLDSSLNLTGSNLPSNIKSLFT